MMGAPKAFRNTRSVLLAAKERLGALACQKESGRQGQSSRTHQLQQWAEDYWIWEFASWFISAMLLLGVVLTLYLHEDRPLPEWPLSITINALISVMSTISTSALILVVSSVIGQGGWSSLSRSPEPLSHLELYDQATRGPLGAFVFLIRIKWDVLSLGPIIILASLATGPFIQQITSIEATEVVVGNVSLSSLAHYPDVRIDDPNNSDIPHSVVGAIYKGLYFTGDLKDPDARNTLYDRHDCPTRNCTYPEFDSLAVCSSCANITDHVAHDHRYPPPKYVVVTYGPDAEPQTESTIIKDPELIDALSRNGTGYWLYDTTLNWTLPNGFAFLNSGMSQSLVQTTGKYHPLLLHSGLPIVNITGIQGCIDGSGHSSGVKAQECMLNWCVNRYKSRVTQGILHEEVLRTAKYGRNINADLLENDTYVFQINNTDTDPRTKGEDIMTVKKGGSQSISYFLADTLSVELQTRDFNPRGTLDYFQPSNYSTSYCPRLPLDMAPTFEALAISMSSALRSTTYNGHPDSVQVVMGQAFKDVPVMRVRWVWITLPVTLQVTTLVLLFYVVMKTPRQKIRVWKTSLLANIFFGARIHDRIAADASGVPDRLVDMKIVAERLEIGPGDLK